MDDKKLKLLLGDNIRKRIKQLGLNQEKTSEYAAISPSHLAEIINGKKWPSDKVLIRLAEALQSQPFELFLPDSNPQSVNIDKLHKVELEMREGFEKLVRANLRNLYSPETE